MSKFLQTAVVVCGLRTELIIQPFADRILVLVTQMGKVGTLIQASIPSMIDLQNASDPQEPLPSPSPAIQLTTMFGSAPSAHMQMLYSLYASHIATLIWMTIEGEPRSVIIGIALHRSRGCEAEDLGEEEQQTFHGVMNALRTLISK